MSCVPHIYIDYTSRFRPWCKGVSIRIEALRSCAETWFMFARARRTDILSSEGGIWIYIYINMYIMLYTYIYIYIYYIYTYICIDLEIWNYLDRLMTSMVCLMIQHVWTSNVVVCRCSSFRLSKVGSKALLGTQHSAKDACD